MAQTEDNHEDEDQVSPLKVPNIKPKHIKTPPHPRRHFSTPVINLEKLMLAQSLDQKEPTPEDDASSRPPFDISMVKDSMKQNPVQFAEELKGLSENITGSKNLPSKSVIDRLLSVMNFWIQHHGIEAIHEQQKSDEKCKTLSSDHEEERSVLQQTIEEYKKECIQHQEQRKILTVNNKELTTKLNEATQQLQRADYFKGQYEELRDELEQKSTENDDNLKAMEDQKKRINELQIAQHQFEKVIESQRIRLSQMDLMETEVKKKTNEVNDAHKKNKVIQAQLELIQKEKEELHKEKTQIHDKLTDYGKLKDNLSQSEENEKQQQQEIMTLKKKNHALNDEVNVLNDKNKEISTKLNVTREQLKTAELLKEQNQMRLDEIKVQQNTIEQLQTDKMQLKEIVTAQNMKLSINMATDNKAADGEPMIEEGEFIEFTIGNNEDKEGLNDYRLKHRTMYRSFLIVGFGCLCYLVYSHVYYGSSLHKVNEMRERYRQWLRSVNMKKRITKKRVTV